MKARLTSLFVVFLVAALLLGLGGTVVLAQPQAPGQSGDKPPGKGPVPPEEVIADRDGDRIFDNLAARLSALPDDHTLPVIVLFDRPVARVDLPAMQRQLGGFAVGHRFAVVDGISTTLTKGQIRAASHVPFVKQVEYDLPVQSTLDGATEWFGVDAASAEWGVSGDADGNASYSKDDVVIAVVDTGIDPNHVDLDGGKIIGWKDIILDRSTPYDDRGHGTHVASIAAGTGEGSGGRYAGVAPGAALVGVKVLDANGSGTESQVLAGIDWVVQNKDLFGIEVMNMSLGAVGSSDGTDALSLAVDRAAASGIVPVIAAGNSGPWRYTVGTPGAASGALTVGAMADVAELGFNLASFSSRGPTADGRIKPDIAAPGYQITAAQVGTSSGYVAYSGTSMATPFTAGVVALMLDRNPGLTVTGVKALLQQTAVDWGPTGADNEYGAGRLDALAAIGAAGPSSSPTGPAVPSHLFYGGRLTAQGTQAFHDLVVSDTTKPMALTLVVANAKCTFVFWGLCFGSDIDYDLDLLDPSGQLVAYSNLPDRQDTINVMPTKTGTYRARVYVCDGCGHNDDYWLDVSLGAAVTPPTNSAPTANGDSYAVNEDAVLTVPAPGVLGNDSDPDGDPLTAVLVGSPANGAATLNANGSFTYTPNADFNGNDSFSYRANDGSLNSNVATVVVTVNPVNDPPMAQNLGSSTNEDASVGVALSASDPDGDSVSYLVVSQPTHGTLAGVAPNLTYTPAPDYYGSDSFTYRASDGSVDSNIATVNVSVNAVNDPPSFVLGPAPAVAEDAVPQTVTSWATAISAGPANEAGQTLTFQVANDNNALFGTQPAVSSDGTLTYTPAANAHGSATVSVTLRDNGGTANGGEDSSDPQTFQITVSPVNDPPAAVDDSYGTNAGTPLPVSAPGVLENDTDVDGDSLTAVLVTGPGNGTLTLNTNGSFTYTPNAGYSGTDSFTYQASDGSAVSNMATVSIAVNAVAVDVEITSVDPSALSAGKSATIEVRGNGFQQGATVSFGERVTVQSVTVSPDGTVITARIKVHPKANLGPRDVVVTNPDDTGYTLVGGFTVS